MRPGSCGPHPRESARLLLTVSVPDRWRSPSALSNDRTTQVAPRRKRSRSKRIGIADRRGGDALEPAWYAVDQAVVHSVASSSLAAGRFLDVRKRSSRFAPVAQRRVSAPSADACWPHLHCPARGVRRTRRRSRRAAPSAGRNGADPTVYWEYCDDNQSGFGRLAMACNCTAHCDPLHTGHGWPCICIYIHAEHRCVCQCGDNPPFMPHAVTLKTILAEDAEYADDPDTPVYLHVGLSEPAARPTRPRRGSRSVREERKHRERWCPARKPVPGGSRHPGDASSRGDLDVGGAGRTPERP